MSSSDSPVPADLGGPDEPGAVPPFPPAIPTPVLESESVPPVPPAIPTPVPESESVDDLSDHFFAAAEAAEAEAARTKAEGDALVAILKDVMAQERLLRTSQPHFSPVQHAAARFYKLWRVTEARKMSNKARRGSQPSPRKELNRAISLLKTTSE